MCSEHSPTTISIPTKKKKRNKRPKPISQAHAIEHQGKVSATIVHISNTAATGNDRTMCCGYIAGATSLPSGKVWCFLFLFLVSLSREGRGADLLCVFRVLPLFQSG